MAGKRKQTGSGDGGPSRKKTTQQRKDEELERVQKEAQAARDKKEKEVQDREARAQVRANKKGGTSTPDLDAERRKREATARRERTREQKQQEAERLQQAQIEAERHRATADQALLDRPGLMEQLEHQRTEITALEEKLRSTSRPNRSEDFKKLEEENEKIKVELSEAHRRIAQSREDDIEAQLKLKDLEDGEKSLQSQRIAFRAECSRERLRLKADAKKAEENRKTEKRRLVQQVRDLERSRSALAEEKERLEQEVADKSRPNNETVTQREVKVEHRETMADHEEMARQASHNQRVSSFRRWIQRLTDNTRRRAFYLARDREVGAPSLSTEERAEGLLNADDSRIGSSDYNRLMQNSPYRQFDQGGLCSFRAWFNGQSMDPFADHEDEDGEERPRFWLEVRQRLDELFVIQLRSIAYEEDSAHGLASCDYAPGRLADELPTSPSPVALSLLRDLDLAIALLPRGPADHLRLRSLTIDQRLAQERAAEQSGTAHSPMPRHGIFDLRVLATRPYVPSPPVDARTGVMNLAQSQAFHPEMIDEAQRLREAATLVRDRYNARVNRYTIMRSVMDEARVHQILHRDLPETVVTQLEEFRIDLGLLWPENPAGYEGQHIEVPDARFDREDSSGDQRRQDFLGLLFGVPAAEAANRLVQVGLFEDALRERVESSGHPRNQKEEDERKKDEEADRMVNDLQKRLEPQRLAKQEKAKKEAEKKAGEEVKRQAEEAKQKARQGANNKAEGQAKGRAEAAKQKAEKEAKRKAKEEAEKKARAEAKEKQQAAKTTVAKHTAVKAECKEISTRRSSNLVVRSDYQCYQVSGLMALLHCQPLIDYVWFHHSHSSAQDIVSCFNCWFARLACAQWGSHTDGHANPRQRIANLMQRELPWLLNDWHDFLRPREMLEMPPNTNAEEALSYDVLNKGREQRGQQDALWFLWHLLETTMLPRTDLPEERAQYTQRMLQSTEFTQVCGDCNVTHVGPYALESTMTILAHNAAKIASGEAGFQEIVDKVASDTRDARCATNPNINDYAGTDYNRTTRYIQAPSVLMIHIRSPMASRIAWNQVPGTVTLPYHTETGQERVEYELRAVLYFFGIIEPAADAQWFHTRNGHYFVVTRTLNGGTDDWEYINDSAPVQRLKDWNIQRIRGLALSKYRPAALMYVRTDYKREAPAK